MVFRPWSHTLQPACSECFFSELTLSPTPDQKPTSAAYDCNTCNGRSHIRTCLGLRSHWEWTERFVALSCWSLTAPSAYTSLDSVNRECEIALKGPLHPRNSHKQQLNYLPNPTPPPTRSIFCVRANQQLLVPHTFSSVCQMLLVFWLVPFPTLCWTTRTQFSLFGLVPIFFFN